MYCHSSCIEQDTTVITCELRSHPISVDHPATYFSSLCPSPIFIRAYMPCTNGKQIVFQSGVIKATHRRVQKSIYMHLAALERWLPTTKISSPSRRAQPSHSLRSQPHSSVPQTAPATPTIAAIPSRPQLVHLSDIALLIALSQEQEARSHDAPDVLAPNETARVIKGVSADAEAAYLLALK